MKNINNLLIVCFSNKKGRNKTTMDSQTYNSIVDVVNKYRGLAKDCLKVLQEQFKRCVDEFFYNSVKLLMFL